MKAKIVYIKAQENADNIQCLHDNIKALNEKIDLLCEFIQEKYELKEEEQFLQKIQLSDLKKDFNEPEKTVVAPKMSKKKNIQCDRLAGGILAVQQKGKRPSVKLLVRRRRAAAATHAKPVKKARRFRKN